VTLARRNARIRLTDFKALSFDCYGTLIDWESGMVAALAGLTSRVQPALTRDQILEAHARHESEQQRVTPGKLYRELLAIVYKRLGEEWRVPVSVDACDAYGQSVRNWPAFPDSPASLQYLKKFYKLIILSNVDNRTFSHSNARLQVEFDAIYSAEDIGAYKPDDKNFHYMFAHLGNLGLKKSEVLHVAESLFHDHAPANRHGLANCWIYRRYEQAGFGATMDPGERPKVAFKFHSLSDLVKAHQETLREQ
jgi:2-haloalkanoic acid dehalogenase type II